MFTCNNPNIIVSDEGFSVQVLGMTGLRYQQGEKSMRVNSESLASPYGLVVYQSSIEKWLEPREEVINDQERARVVDNIRRAFAFRNIEVAVI